VARSADDTSTIAAEAEAYSDPACGGRDQINAKEQAEDIEARETCQGDLNCWT
jgi:hypothetical protein